MRIISTSFMAAAGLVAATGIVHANGFLLNEHDAAAVGRGNAVTATDIDGSSLVYNPGGLAVSDGTRVFIGSALVIHDESFTPTGSDTKSKSTEGPAPLPELYVTHKVNDVLAVGVGLHTPFGSEISWAADSPTASIIRDQTLRTYYLTAGVGVNLDKVIPGLSIGGIFDVVPATVDLKQDIPFGDQTGSAHLGGNAVGFGGGGGIMYRPPAVPQLSLGVMYHSSVKEEFTGNANFTAPSPFRTELPPDGPIKTTIKLPQMWLAGVAFRPIPNLELEVDGQWIDWSLFRNLEIGLPNGTTQVSVKDYKNTFSGRFGVQYNLPAQHLAIRAGYMYDTTPVPSTTLDATLPDTNRNDITIGASYYLRNIDFHAGVLYVVQASRDTSTTPGTPPFKGQYEVTAVVPVISVGGRFGAGK